MPGPNDIPEWLRPSKDPIEASGNPVPYFWNEIKKGINPAAVGMMNSPTYEALTDPATRSARLQSMIPVTAQQGNLDALGRMAQTTRNREQVKYDTSQADQARTGQMGAYQMMLERAQGPSIASVQGQNAQAQALAQAAQAQVANQGSGVQGQAAQAMGGLAGDAGQLAAKENLQNQQGMFKAAQQMRGGDITQAESVAKTNLASKTLTDQLVAKLLQQGYSLGEAMRAGRAAAEDIDIKVRQDQIKKTIDVAGTGAAMALEAAAGRKAGDS